MMVVVIIAILAAVAYPSYQDSIRKTRRSDAKAGLTLVEQTLHRCFTQFMTYDSTDCTVDNGDTVNSPEGYYPITVTSNATTFTLTATPPVGTPQRDDTACRTFALDQAGNVIVVDDSANDTTATCW